MRWLSSKRIKIGLEFRELYSSLMSLSGDLTVARIMSLDEAAQGLLIAACQVACRRPDSEQAFISEEEFVRELRAQYSYEKISDHRQANNPAPREPGLAARNMVQ